jgi:hypothetical protein
MARRIFGAEIPGGYGKTENRTGVMAEEILAELGAFDDEGAFPGADFLIPKEASDQVSLRASQRQEKRTHVRLCSGT